MNLIGITGKAGSGKDTVADILCRNHGFVRVTLADVMKRFCKEIFGFADEQLWGPSEFRNAPDKRFPRKHSWPQGDVNTYSSEMFLPCSCCGLRADAPYSDEPCYLTPRFALQRLGTEWGRDCFEDVWIDYAMRVTDALLIGEKYRRHSYTAQLGSHDRGEGQGPEEIRGVVIPDVRFPNELARVRSENGRIWHRPGKTSLSTSAAAHLSERSIDGDEECDARILWQDDPKMLESVIAMLLEAHK